MRALVMGLGLGLSCAMAHEPLIDYNDYNVYGSVAGGSSFILAVTDTTGNVGFRRHYDLGYHAFGSLGIKRGMWRFEVQGGYFRNGIDKIELTSVPEAGSSQTGGHINSMLFMFNVLLDIESPYSPVTPYVGGGVGYAYHASKIYVQGFTQGGAPAALPSEVDKVHSDHLAMFQGITGLKYYINESLDLFMDYRYMISTRPGRPFNSHLNRHVLSGGFTVKFG